MKDQRNNKTPVFNSYAEKSKYIKKTNAELFKELCSKEQGIAKEIYRNKDFCILNVYDIFYLLCPYYSEEPFGLIVSSDDAIEFIRGKVDVGEYISSTDKNILLDRSVSLKREAFPQIYDYCIKKADLRHGSGVDKDFEKDLKVNKIIPIALKCCMSYAIPAFMIGTFMSIMSYKSVIFLALAILCMVVLAASAVSGLFLTTLMIRRKVGFSGIVVFFTLLAMFALFIVIPGNIDRMSSQPQVTSVHDRKDTPYDYTATKPSRNSGTNALHNNTPSFNTSTSSQKGTSSHKGTASQTVPSIDHNGITYSINEDLEVTVDISSLKSMNIPKIPFTVYEYKTDVPYSKGTVTEGVYESEFLRIHGYAPEDFVIMTEEEMNSVFSSDNYTIEWEFGIKAPKANDSCKMLFTVDLGEGADNQKCIDTIEALFEVYGFTTEDFTGFSCFADPVKYKNIRKFNRGTLDLSDQTPPEINVQMINTRLVCILEYKNDDSFRMYDGFDDLELYNKQAAEK